MTPSHAASRDAHHAASARASDMLRTALGDAIACALDDPDVIEVMVNPDGRLWLDRLSNGRSSTDTMLTAADVERIVRLVAAHSRQEVHARSPMVSAELPDRGERFQGMLPPVVPAPLFCIRKPASSVISLDTYVERGCLSGDHATALIGAIHARRNILIAGPTSSGKTTFANALLAEIAVFGDRIVLLEDTVELQCTAQDYLALRTLPGAVSMRDLVHATLRLRPDRIVVGEVRGGEALDLIKAWGTGHGGGIATIHAGSAHGALHRLEQLILEAAAAIPRHLIAEAIDLIVVMRNDHGLRIVSDIVNVVGLDADHYVLKPIPTKERLHESGNTEIRNVGNTRHALGRACRVSRVCSSRRRACSIAISTHRLRRRR